MPSLTATVRTASFAVLKDSVTVTYDLYRKESGGAKTAVWTGRRLTEGQAVKLTEVSELPSGYYMLEFRAVSAGDTARAVYPFVLFDSSDTRPVGDRVDWYYCARGSVSPSRPARIQVGSGAKDVTLYYMLVGKDSVWEDRHYELTESILTFVNPSVGNGHEALTALFYFVKDGQMYSHSQMLVPEEPDRTLRMEWTSFRDRLRPGEEETWKLRVRTPDGKPASAQLMATLYDASLDAIAPHQWNPSRYVIGCASYVDLVSSLNWNYWQYRPLLNSGTVPPLSFDSFNPWMFTPAYSRVHRGYSIYNCLDTSPANFLGGRIRGVALYEQAVVKKASADVASTDSGDGEDTDASADEAAQVSFVRKNLNETAFFYPRLMADKNGDVDISFTLPESLTSWKFMALAHTKDFDLGIFSDTVVAVKDVMAQLDLPRFVRRGDSATLSTSLYNLTQKTLKGEVTMEIFDPATGKTLWKENRNLKMAAGADTVVSFAYVPDRSEVTLPACRVLFKAGRYTDGEQRYLPILEDREWLTQTLPFTVAQQGDTTIRLDGLFQKNHPEATHRRLTVEYSANPLWYAVQALPSVVEPRTDDALSLGAAYYASVLSSDLVAQYPQMKTAVDAWQAKGTDRMESPLTQREDLKGILLDETPLVADAESDTRRIQSLQQLFDANRQSGLQQTFCMQLGRLQRADGSFSWFGGMSGNCYITLRVARLLLRSEAGEKASSVLTQYVDVKKMMKYLAGEMHKEVSAQQKRLQTKGGKNYFNGQWIDYLYATMLCASSLFDASERKDMDYMVDRLVKDMYDLPLADKAEAAVILQRKDRKDEAAQLVRSLYEHLVNDSEGLHLEYPSNGSVSSVRKIAVHTALMEAFSATGNYDAHTLDGMRRWLLGQKRLQDWGTSVSSMDAIYALLQPSTTGLSLQTADEIRVDAPSGKGLIRMKSSESPMVGLGTVTARVDGRDLNDGAGTLTVKKSRGGSSAWGAVYAQFQLPLTDVESSASGMRVRCETDHADLRVGDRVTLRYVITADRDYEYVCLKAGRAACLEPVEVRSGYEYRNGLGYYKEVKDASTNYFFERLPKGTYILETECYVERAGRYTVGAAKLNGVYASEFCAYGAAQTMEVRP
ncbi:MAG: hypothetical protein LUC45_04160 [Paraprevotella sp.]|nr:hypothetical protein [Paraprevotella sp.]